MRVRQWLPLALTLGLLVLVSWTPLAQQFVSSGPSPAPETPSDGQLPLSFEANQGQANNQVRFLAHGPGYSIFLTPQQALLALDASASASNGSFSPGSTTPPSLASGSAPTLVGMRFLNANPQPEVTGERPLPGSVNYFLTANPATWHTNIPTFAQVRYHSIYPGIDLLYDGSQGHLEYDLLVAPGSDPSQIHLAFTGVERLSLDPQGTLLLHLPAGALPEAAPQVYQNINGVRKPVASSYVLQGTMEVAFALGAYDARQPLVIDPSVLFSTYLGGLNNDESAGLVVDSQGNTYVTGTTSSTNFPSQNPQQATSGGGPSDAFVTKINAAGTAVVYSTYLGGNGADWGTGIAIDGAGNAYITGGTGSTNFPTQNALQSANAGTTNAFVAELNAGGTALVYSTYLGGNGADWGTGIAVDGSGNAYITGVTSSTNFPTQNALQATFGGGSDDAFIAKVHAAGTALVYSTYLGGNGADWGTGIAVDGAGNAHITGGTGSSNFPTDNPLQSTNIGTANAFVAELNAAGAALVYATYLGGTNYDYASGIALDTAGDTFVTGITHSSDFPTHNPFQSTNGGSSDVFVAELNAAGTALVYSTYLGGNGADWGTSIVVDGAGNAYVTGSTSSGNFPTDNPLQSVKSGASDAFVTEVFVGGKALLYSSYLGGSNGDEGTGIAVGGTGTVYVTGVTASSNFPTSHPIQGYGGMEEGFLAKMSLMTSSSLNLFAIDRNNTQSGTTEVNVLSGANSFQSFLLQTPTALEQTGSDGSWAFLLADYNGDGIADLWAIKKANTAGTTEVHILNGANHFQTFLLHTATALGTTGTDNSVVFGVADYNGDGHPDLWAIAKANTGSKTTEVHILNGTNFQSFLLHTTTALGTTGTDNSVVFGVGDYNGDGHPDLWAIAKANTGSKTTEVHILNGAANFQTWLLHATTALGTTGSDGSWNFSLADYNGDGHPDLWAIDKANTTSGMTETYILNGANVQTFLAYTPTALQQTGTDSSWVFGVARYTGGGHPDLWAIDKANTASATTEVNVLSGTNNFQSFLLQTPTALGQTGTDNSWAFILADYNGDGIPDLWAIAKTNTGSKTTEVHILDGANHFQTFLLHTATALGTTGTDSSWVFLVGDYNGDGHPDLWAINKANTGSGTTEVHILNGTNFQTWLLHTATALQQTGTDNSWNFSLGDYNGDGHPDLWAIAKANTSSGMTEASILNGANFQSFLLHTTTALGITGTDSSWVFLVGDYNGDGHPDLWAINKANTSSATTEVHILNGTNFQAVLVQTATALQQTGSDNSWAFALG
jgi:hypothetical protein